jgi:hypothetical protein
MVRIDESGFRSVVYLGTESGLKGTGFWVLVEEPGDVSYVVTARHNVEMAEEETIFVRLNTDTGAVNVRTAKADWFVSDTDDVAVIAGSRLPSGASWSKGYTLFMFEAFVDADYKAPMPGHGPVGVAVGDEILFVGLFHLAAGERENLPIARMGTIARMPTETIQLPRNKVDVYDGLVYLAETRSFGGHSGAPVSWIYKFFERTAAPNIPGGFVDTPRHASFLLGLVSGHFDEYRSVQSGAKAGVDPLSGSSVKANTGIAYITPAEAIRELLMRDDVRDDRDAEMARWNSKQGGPTTDSVETENEFDPFGQLARKLVNRPKPEKDEKRETDQ